MNKVVEFLKENPVQYLATVGRDSQASNPIFEVFYIKNAHGSIADFSGNPPMCSNFFGENDEKSGSYGIHPKNKGQQMAAAPYFLWKKSKL